MKRINGKTYNMLNGRLLRMDKTATTTQLVRTLGISESSLRRWSAQDDCISAGIVLTDGSGGIVWNTAKLRLYLIFKGQITEPLRKVESNPPAESFPTPDEAALALWGKRIK